MCECMYVCVYPCLRGCVRMSSFYVYEMGAEINPHLLLLKEEKNTISENIHYSSIPLFPFLTDM